jgi:Mn-containing catalase
LDARNSYHVIASGQTALPVDSRGNPWNGSYVFSSGTLKLDLLHNFFLECGARANKIRVYEMCDDDTSRAMLGYLLVQGRGEEAVQVSGAHRPSVKHLTLGSPRFPPARRSFDPAC